MINEFEKYAIRMLEIYGGPKGLIKSALASFGFMGFMPVLYCSEEIEIL